MAVNQTGIAITIKAFLPTGETIKEQRDTLDKVVKAHETGDYSDVLKAAIIDSVKSEQKTRRVENPVAATIADGLNEALASAKEEPLSFVGDEELANALKEEDQRSELAKEFDPTGELANCDEPAATDAEVPEFLKAGKKK